MRCRGAWRHGLALAALALALSACSPGGYGEDDSNDSNDSNAAGSGGGDGEPQRQAPVSAPTPPEQVLASRDGSSGEVPLRIEVTDLFRQGQLVTVNFSVNYRTPDDGEQSGNWQVANAFGDGNADNGHDTVDGVYLVDDQNRKRHLVARDSEDQCVCSTGLGSTFVDPGQTLVLTATFAAPPPDVEAVDVQIPLAGTFSDVPIR